jgi:hypothetical protein
MVFLDITPVVHKRVCFSSIHIDNYEIIPHFVVMDLSPRLMHFLQLVRKYEMWVSENNSSDDPFVAGPTF